jgi:hypothetical protein
MVRAFPPAKPVPATEIVSPTLPLVGLMVILERTVMVLVEDTLLELALTPIVDTFMVAETVKSRSP